MQRTAPIPQRDRQCCAAIKDVAAQEASDQPNAAGEGQTKADRGAGEPKAVEHQGAQKQDSARSQHRQSTKEGDKSQIPGKLEPPFGQLHRCPCRRHCEL